MLPCADVDDGERVLLVEDDAGGAEVTAAFLRRAGYQVDLVRSGLAALESVGVRPPDAMVLDYELPDMDAPDVLDRLRAGGSRVPFPVLVLTGARPGAADQVLSLDRGAVDYLVKGTDRQVVLAKLRVALRERAPDPALTVGGIRIDRAQGRAWAGGEELKLQRKPLDVLFQLARRAGRVVTREELLAEVWGTRYEGFDHSLEQAVYAIRRTLPPPSAIVTVPGRGYRLIAGG